MVEVGYILLRIEEYCYYIEMICFISLSIVFFKLFPRILVGFRKGVIEVSYFFKSLYFTLKIAVEAFYRGKLFLKRAVTALIYVALYFISDIDKLEEGIFKILEVVLIAISEDILA